ncbi:transporter substrate-binding domain-containing protein [Maledivibacter halophilus]|uniref:Polar amino acid transport system substrate-binding protein n=1 Tax=Maledivibacter halophilus TaxID=36842 RepID=A0A1T5LJX4_9FIRM|nr:transporter substrate-binding domain-containing protein [Maledivibacter halophilus]SKC76303.1 polar amino acid transport system substrate-binding protein [Maledivibacter halophilus]
MNKKLNQIIGVILILMTVFSLIGCGSSNTADNNESKEQTVLEKIQEKGVIVVGTSPDYPPFETIDEKGNIVGFDIDLANEIAAKLGVDLELKQMSFETIVTAVQSGQVDVGISGFSVTEERKENVDMSEPYLVGGQVVVTTTDSGIESVEDLNGEKVTAGMGSTCEQAANKIEGAEVVSLDDFNMGFIMVKNGTAKAVVADVSVAKDYVANDSSYTIIGEPLSYEETAVITKKGNDDLTKAINEAINEIKESGKIDEFKKAWGVE